MRRSRRRIGANDVVREHPADRIAFLFQPFQQVRASQQSLFLARNRREQNRRAKPALSRSRQLAQQPRALHAHRCSRRIVVSPGGVRVGIHHIRRPRIEMPRHHKNRLRHRRIAPRQNRVHVFQRHCPSRGSASRRLELIHLHFQLFPILLGNFLQTRHDFVPPASNPPLRIRPGRKRQARSARHQLVDQVHHGLCVHAAPLDRSIQARRTLLLGDGLRRFRRISSIPLLRAGHPRHQATRHQRSQRRFARCAHDLSSPHFRFASAFHFFLFFSFAFTTCSGGSSSPSMRGFPFPTRASIRVTLAGSAWRARSSKYSWVRIAEIFSARARLTSWLSATPSESAALRASARSVGGTRNEKYCQAISHVKRFCRPVSFPFGDARTLVLTFFLYEEAHWRALERPRLQL